jgi:hypothetical protein
MSRLKKVWDSFFPAMPHGRQRRHRSELWLGLGLGILAAGLFAVAIYFLQERLMR